MTEKSQNHGTLAGAPEENEGASDDDPGPSSLTVLIEDERWHELESAAAIVKRAYGACLTHFTDIEGCELSILLSSDAAIADLNGRYRGKPKPTNVLSFPAADLSYAQPDGEPVPLGDIIIAFETVFREAGDEGKAVSAHLSHLVVHGILHLAGYDHESDAEAEEMEQLECEILASIDIPDPYSMSVQVKSSPMRLADG